MKPIISLTDTIGTGVVIAFPSGVVFSSQVAGTACLSPELEGIYVPFGNDYLADGRTFIGLEVDLVSYFLGPKYQGDGARSGLDTEDAAFINALLSKHRVLDWIEVDAGRLHESREAWIFVLVKKDSFMAAGFSAYPVSGVLTWSNSD